MLQRKPGHVGRLTRSSTRYTVPFLYSAAVRLHCVSRATLSRLRTVLQCGSTASAELHRPVSVQCCSAAPLRQQSYTVPSLYSAAVRLHCVSRATPSRLSTVLQCGSTASAELHRPVSVQYCSASYTVPSLYSAAVRLHCVSRATPSRLSTVLQCGSTASAELHRPVSVQYCSAAPLRQQSYTVPSLYSAAVRLHCVSRATPSRLCTVLQCGSTASAELHRPVSVQCCSAAPLRQQSYTVPSLYSAAVRLHCVSRATPSRLCTVLQCGSTASAELHRPVSVQCCSAAPLRQQSYTVPSLYSAAVRLHCVSRATPSRLCTVLQCGSTASAELHRPVSVQCCSAAPLRQQSYTVPSLYSAAVRLHCVSRATPSRLCTVLQCGSTASAELHRPVSVQCCSAAPLRQQSYTVPSLYSAAVRLHCVSRATPSRLCTVLQCGSTASAELHRPVSVQCCSAAPLRQQSYTVPSLYSAAVRLHCISRATPSRLCTVLQCGSTASAELHRPVSVQCCSAAPLRQQSYTVPSAYSAAVRLHCISRATLSRLSTVLQCSSTASVEQHRPVSVQYCSAAPLRQLSYTVPSLYSAAARATPSCLCTVLQCGSTASAELHRPVSVQCCSAAPLRQQSYTVPSPYSAAVRLPCVSRATPSRLRTVLQCGSPASAELHRPVSVQCCSAAPLRQQSYTVPSPYSAAVRLPCVSRATPSRLRTVLQCGSPASAELHRPVSVQCCSAAPLRQQSYTVPSPYSAAVRLPCVSRATPSRLRTVLQCGSPASAELHRPVSVQCCSAAPLRQQSYTVPSPYSAAVRLPCVSRATPSRLRTVLQCGSPASAELHRPVSVQCCSAAPLRQQSNTVPSPYSAAVRLHCVSRATPSRLCTVLQCGSTASAELHRPVSVQCCSAAPLRQQSYTVPSAYSAAVPLPPVL
ncbi:UNVERIFIED_CONTAM: hypothetical protein FKN15_010882 [Acipenser sinensis]